MGGLERVQDVFVVEEASAEPQQMTHPLGFCLPNPRQPCRAQPWLQRAFSSRLGPLRVPAAQSQSFSSALSVTGIAKFDELRTSLALWLDIVYNYIVVLSIVLEPCHK